MSRITIYEKPTCTTCREVGQILKELNIPFESVNYYIHPLEADEIRGLLKKMGMPASKLARKKEPIYKELGLDKKDPGEEEWVRLFAKYPDLMQRPIIEKGSKAILARPAETARVFLKA